MISFILLPHCWFFWSNSFIVVKLCPLCRPNNAHSAQMCIFSYRQIMSKGLRCKRQIPSSILPLREPSLKIMLLKKDLKLKSLDLAWCFLTVSFPYSPIKNSLCDSLFYCLFLLLCLRNASRRAMFLGK